MLKTLAVLAAKGKDRTALNARWAILAMNWINRNFQTEGGMVGGWAPLSDNTLAARRKGSGRILQDTGLLRMSFTPEWTSEFARVGSPLDIALYHEQGTGIHGPKHSYYPIYPKKPGGVLRFTMATSTGVKTKEFKSGKKMTFRVAEGAATYVKYVEKHPGVAKRRMLPTENDETLMRDLYRAALDYMKVQASEVGNVKE